MNAPLVTQSLIMITHIVRLTLHESQRRRVLWLVLLLGASFLTVFGTGFHFIYLEFEGPGAPGGGELPFTFLVLAGLYVTNFLIIIMSVLLSVAGISSELENHTLEAIVTKPIARWQIVIGKWLAYALLILGCVLLLPGGVLLIANLRAGVTVTNAFAGLTLIFLEGLLMMSINIVGGMRLSTMANGALAMMLYGIAFIGGWVEQVGAVFQNETAVDLGILASLVMPAEALWKRASTYFVGDAVLGNQSLAGPFTVASQPSELMVVYSVFYLAAAVAIALVAFTRRDL